MAIITLTTDWGTSDYYLAAVKGTILSYLPDATIVDISNHIPQYDLAGAAFNLRNCYRNFPQGSLHIIGVNTEESIETPHIVAKMNGHYFVGCDNGVFSMLFDEFPEEVIEIEVPQDSDFFTFSTRDRFVKVAVHILKGGDLDSLGGRREFINQRMLFQPTVTETAIKGLVMHIDAYGNLITNISYKLFKQASKNRTFEIYFNSYRIRKIHTQYREVGVPELVALFGSHNFLEIAINQGSAATLCGMMRNSPVYINFL
ncbi:MAG: SAM-dependent chlorinase/fluorinase [Bacteroidales bacterium]|nr:SAM-dependent chlorinase/fluorinase [Bacteroidales bacterium]